MQHPKFATAHIDIYEKNIRFALVCNVFILKNPNNSQI